VFAYSDNYLRNFYVGENGVLQITCYNCGETGHLSSKCTKPKKAAGKVFALNAEEVEQPDNLI